MKNQYFGDVNDYRKYGLLRILCKGEGFRTGVCWMLSEADETRDGGKTEYLGKRDDWEPFDPQLFDFLHRFVVGHEDDEEWRCVQQIERAAILPSAVFYTETLGDNLEWRTSFFSVMFDRFCDVDLIFFDPDNGFERPSGKPKRGNTGSSKFLYWNEFMDVYQRGHSVLVYQHFPLERKESFEERFASQIRERSQDATVFAYKTPHVVFMLASQPRHVLFFRERTVQLKDSRWGKLKSARTSKSTETKQILCTEHSKSR